jgi:hypothetical protein
MSDSKPDYDAVSREDGQIEQHPSYAMIHPIAVLFPKIYMGADDECDASDEGGDEDVLFHGYALFHTQGAVMAASKEWTQSQPYQRPIRRRTSEHGRRASVLVPKEVVRVNGILPTSPETSYSQRMAASQNNNSQVPPAPGTRARDSAVVASSLSSNRSQRSGSGSGVGGGGGGQ